MAGGPEDDRGLLAVGFTAVVEDLVEGGRRLLVDPMPLSVFSGNPSVIGMTFVPGVSESARGELGGVPAEPTRLRVPGTVRFEAFRELVEDADAFPKELFSLAAGLKVDP